MKKLKEYLGRKKIDKRFKNLGEGYILSGQTQTTSTNSINSSQQVYIYKIVIIPDLKTIKKNFYTRSRVIYDVINIVVFFLILRR